MKLSLRPTREGLRPAFAALFALVFLFAAKVRSNVAVTWNEALADASAGSSIVRVPHLEARAYAMVHLAMDAAIAFTAHSAGAFSDPVGAQRAAVSSAAHTMLRAVMPEGAARFDALHRAQLAAMPAGDECDRALRIGREAAGAVLEKRKMDGWVALGAFDGPEGPAADGSRQGAAALAAGAEPVRSPWHSLTPFLLKNVGQFEAEVPHSVEHDGGVRTNFAVINERFFKDVDRSGTPDALTLAWSGDAFTAWNRVARAVIASGEFDLQREARMLAMLNVALADATVAAQHWRFTLGSWRVTSALVWQEIGSSPERSTDVMAIVDKGVSTVAVRDELRRVLIPPLRDYPSLNATVAGAAQAALATFCKTDRVAFTVALPAASDGTSRSFASFSQAGRECAFVAALDGRHCRESCVAGYILGAAVGNYVAKRAGSGRY